MLDPSVPDMGMSDFERQDWNTSKFAHLLERDEESERPSHLPTLIGTGFEIRRKSDANHAADVVARRSRTGLVVYLNSSPTFWFSRKQNIVESTSFVS